MVDRRYWDSACFIAWFKEEPGRAETCGSILQAAQEGNIQIVTSAFSIAEVLFPQAGERLSQQHRDTVRMFFRRPEFLFVQVDRPLAEAAQRYVWEFGVRPKDAIHVASAVYAEAPVLETYDGGLIKLNGRLGGSPVLAVREPVPVVGSEELDLLDELNET